MIHLRSRFCRIRRMFGDLLTEVYCFRINNGAGIRLWFVMNYGCVWTCRRDGVEGEANKILVFAVR